MFTALFDRAKYEFEHDELSLFDAEKMLLSQLTPQNIAAAMQERLPLTIRNLFLCSGAEFALEDPRYNSKDINAVTTAQYRQGIQIICDWLLLNPSYHEAAKQLAADAHTEWKRTVEAEQRERLADTKIEKRHRASVDGLLDLGP